MSDYVRRVPTAERPIASRLGQLDIELTERCDNDCIHCCINLPAGDAAARAREMTTGQVMDVLRQAADLGCLSVRFTGGEPLLRPDFEELYLCARRLGLAVLIFTNARRITPDLADLLARVPPRELMEVTVYGMRRESYEAVSRVPGSFAQFRRGVDLLLERQIPFVVKGALLPPNRAEIDEFEAWAATIPWMTEPPGYAMFFDLRNRRDDPAKNRLIESLRVSPEEGLAVLTRDAAKYRAEMAEFGARFMGPPGDRAVPLRRRPRHLASTPTAARSRAWGCVRPSSRSTCSASSLARRPRALRLTSASCAPRTPSTCAAARVCFLQGLCEQCPAKSWAEHGTLDTPVEYLCEVAHAQARCLGWLEDGENGWEAVKWRERVV